MILLRILTALAAAVIYYVLCTIVAFGVLVIAAWRGHNLGYDVGYEPRPWWEWLILIVWSIGLIFVVWWAAFRLSWWRGSDTSEGEVQEQSE